MIKTNAPIMQAIYQPTEVDVPEDRRKFLAEKGQYLYQRYCTTRGHGICSESFAEYHLWRGELCIVRDFLAFLRQQEKSLHQLADYNPAQFQDRLTITQNLIKRIEHHFNEKEPQPE